MVNWSKQKQYPIHWLSDGKMSYVINDSADFSGRCVPRDFARPGV